MVNTYSTGYYPIRKRTKKVVIFCAEKSVKKKKVAVPVDKENSVPTTTTTKTNKKVQEVSD